MKVKQIQIVKAYEAMDAIRENTSFSVDILWKLYELRKILAPHCEFQQERETALRNKYDKFFDKDGKISGQPMIDYQKEFLDVINLEKEIDWEPIELPIVPGLSFGSMEDMEPFITFKKPE